MSIDRPTVNDLGRVVSDARARAAIYGTYVVLLVVAGALTIGYATVGAGVPTWVAVTNAVLTYLGVPVGGLALANVKPTPAAAEDSDLA